MFEVQTFSVKVKLQFSLELYDIVVDFGGQLVYVVLVVMVVIEIVDFGVNEVVVQILVEVCFKGFVLIVDGMWLYVIYFLFGNVLVIDIVMRTVEVVIQGCDDSNVVQCIVFYLINGWVYIFYI